MKEIRPELIGALNTQEGLAVLLIAICIKLGVTEEEMSMTAASLLKARANNYRG